MHKIILNIAIAPLLLILSSFTDKKEVTYDKYVVNHQDYKEFIHDAYNFRLNNNIAIPDFYYDVLEMDNPNIPAWAKQVALPMIRDSVPLWIRKGQLMKESSSYYNPDGTIKYVNKKRGGNNNRHKGLLVRFKSSVLHLII